LGSPEETAHPGDLRADLVVARIVEPQDTAQLGRVRVSKVTAGGSLSQLPEVLELRSRAEISCAFRPNRLLMRAARRAHLTEPRP
jgi:hypothetical protein